MSDYTVVRIDIDSDVVRRAARAVPGVEVPEEFDPETERVTPLPGRTDTVADDADAVDDGSGRGGQPRSLVGEYGLLAAAVAMIGAGVATAGLWWYRRRNRDSAPTPETEFESPAWEETAVAATEDQPGSTGTVPNPDGVPGDRVAGDDDTAVAGDDSTGAGPTEFDAPTVDTPTDEPDTDAEPDASEAERDEQGAPTAEESSEAATERVVAADTTAESASESDADKPAPSADESELAGDGSLDRAPLLGVAFVALSGAVVRWLQRES
ncbi:hypothetical protein [Haloarcula pelagica]|uniref:hypothetical protein n=1 Tax=Haloarcula pelagica TaxID=3033389 RepID=UPI0024C4349A|nr:hypothetical protein [Halomicroarcula sp. YJ-61-S]